MLLTNYARYTIINLDLRRAAPFQFKSSIVCNNREGKVGYAGPAFFLFIFNF